MQFNGDVLPIVQIHRFPRMELCQPLGARPDPLLRFGCHESAAERLVLHLDARARSTILLVLRTPRLPTVARAEQLLAGHGWLPECLRTQPEADTSVAGGAEVDEGSRTAAAVDAST